MMSTAAMNSHGVQVEGSAPRVSEKRTRKSESRLAVGTRKVAEVSSIAVNSIVGGTGGSVETTLTKKLVEATPPSPSVTVTVTWTPPGTLKVLLTWAPVAAGDPSLNDHV